MYDAAIEINDIEFSIWQSDERTCIPAYALLETGGLLFGEQARQRARLHPLQINNRFIQQLTMVETPELKPFARHHADLAYRFLQFAHQQTKGVERGVFLVPPNYDEQHMAVLLGVARQCSFDAVGLLDQTVAVASDAAQAASGVFCDLQLHQIVIGGFEIEDDHVQRTSTMSLDGLGLLDLHERWVRIIADAFIQQCRFDPLHDAAIEQQLWDLLPEKLHSNNDDTVFQFDLLNKHHAKVEREQMLAPVKTFVEQLQSRLVSFGPVQQVLCSHRLSGLPGFIDMDARMQPVGQQRMAEALKNHQQRVCTNTPTLPFITRLPVKKNNVPNLPRTRPRPVQHTAERTCSSAEPSHFMLDNVAWPLTAATVYLDTLGEAIVWSQQPGSVAVAELGFNHEGHLALVPINGAKYWLNGEAREFTSEPLKKGDVVKLTESGAELRLVEVAAPAGVRGNEA